LRTLPRERPLWKRLLAPTPVEVAALLAQLLWLLLLPQAATGLEHLLGVGLDLPARGGVFFLGCNVVWLLQAVHTERQPRTPTSSTTSPAGSGADS
jgi:hypothetical protein